MTKEYDRRHWCDNCGAMFAYPPETVHQDKAGRVWQFCRRDCWNRWQDKSGPRVVEGGQNNTPEELIRSASIVARCAAVVATLYAFRWTVEAIAALVDLYYKTGGR